MKPVLLLLALASIGLAQSVSTESLKTRAKPLKGEVLVYYDKFKDESHITSKPRNLVGTSEGAASIIASGGLSRMGTPLVIVISVDYFFSGQKLTETPNEFAIVFDSISPEWMYLKGDRNLYILYDDKRIQLETVGRDADFGHTSGVNEKIAYTITRTQLKDLAAATKVDIRIGNTRPRTIKPNILKSWQMVLDVTAL